MIRFEIRGGLFAQFVSVMLDTCKLNAAPDF